MRTRKRTTLTPTEEGITNALVMWLEEAIIGTTGEDLEVVNGNDPGEPADPYLAVFVSVAGGKQSPVKRFEITLAIMAEEATWLPDDAEEMMDEIHEVFAKPVSPNTDDGSEESKPFSSLLCELADMADDGLVPSFFKIKSLTEEIEPRLAIHAPEFEHRIYSGGVNL